MNENRNQRQMCDWITMLTFCAIDMQLYLDTHPTDQDGIDYYNQCIKMLNRAKLDYAEACGTDTAAAGVPYQTVFSWADTPMPWEGECR